MYKITFPNNEDLEKICKKTIEIFEVDQDDTQAQPSVEKYLKVIKKEKYNFVCIKDNDNPIAWSLVIPTSKVNMNRFLNKDINERELMDLSREDSSFETLYLFYVIVLPEYRKRGLAKLMRVEQIAHFKEKYGITDFYVWWYSKEGQILSFSLEKELDVSIKGIVGF